MQISEHVYVMHIDDGGVAHPGGSNNYFVGDPDEEMTIIDTGEHDREWTGMILDYYEELGRPKINSILITHGHQDHVGGADRVHDATGAPVRCHPKLAERLEKMVGKGTVSPLKSREVIRTGGGATLRALFTPGHEIDHVCYYLKEDRIMFTGDSVLGASSSTVRDLSSYMKSLRLLTRFPHDTVGPAHGPVVPAAERQKALCSGTSTTGRSASNRCSTRWRRVSRRCRTSRATSTRETSSAGCARPRSAT